MIPFPQANTRSNRTVLGLKRMHVYTVAVLVLLNILSISGRTAGTSLQGKPVSLEPIYTYFKAPPATLSEMIAEAELVVQGRVVGHRPKDNADLGATRTAHRVEVLEIVRDSPLHPVTTDEIEVVRTGGERDRGHYIEKSYQVGFPQFDNGRQYLLFLVWNKALNSWVPAYGPDSAVDLTSGVADSSGKSAAVQKLKGKAAAEVLDIVRRGGE